jgi:sec-independent protein translocase protein TatA
MGGQFSLIHWLVVILILMLLFGPNKIESLGRSLGRAIRGFKEGMNEIDTPAQDLSSQPPTGQLPGSQNSQTQQTQTHPSQTQQSAAPKKDS